MRFVTWFDLQSQFDPMLRCLILVLFFTAEAAASPLDTSPLDQPTAQTTSDLLEAGDFNNLDQYLNGLRAARAKDASGYLQLTHAYLRFWGHGLNVNLAQNKDLDIEAQLRHWRTAKPHSIGAVTATAIFLAQRVKALPAGSRSQQDAMSDALDFIQRSQSIGEADPHWGATHLEVLALQNTASGQFEQILEQAERDNLPPFPLYIGAGLYLRHHDQQRLLPFVLNADRAELGLSARLFTYFAPFLSTAGPEAWEPLKLSYKSVLADYPSDWNRQSLAKAACAFGDFKEAALHIEKLPWLDNLDLWGQPDVPQACRDTILELELWSCEEALTSACMTLEPRLSALERGLIIVGATLLGSLVVNWIITHRRMKKAPRITLDEVQAVKAAREASKLPRVRIENTGQAPTLDVQSKLGGLPSSDANHSDWPRTGETGMPMLFLAQINLDDMPKLTDFPSHGLLQVFAGIEEDGHLINTEDAGAFELRYLPKPQNGQTLALPNRLRNLGKGAALSPDVIQNGQRITFEEDTDHSCLYHRHLDHLWRDWSERQFADKDARQAADALLSPDELESDAAPAHWIGGHPDFIQDDVRADPAWRDMDRVILHLGFDDDVCIGDAGMLNVMMTQSDLRQGAFDKAICTWDCG